MNSPFEDLTKFQKKKLFDLLEVHFYKFTRNQEILPTLKHENIIGIIMQGSAQIINIEYNGNEIIMEELLKDSVFGTNISLTNSDEHQMLPDEDKVVEDYLNLGYYVIKKLKIKNVSYLTFNDQEEDSLIRIIAVDKDEKEYPLDWDGVVPKSNGDLTEMIYEVETIFDWNLRYYYKAQTH